MLNKYIVLYRKNKYKGAFDMKTSERGLIHSDRVKTMASNNLSYIIDELGMNHKEFAEEFNISEQTLSEYLNGTALPTLQLLIELKNRCGISIDEFLTSEIEYSSQLKQYRELTDSVEIKMLRRFCGVYYMHYFDTTVYKYTNITDKLKPRISCGLLQIYEERTPLGNSCFKASAITCCTRSECTKFFADISTRPEIKTLLDLDVSQVKRHHFYTGEIDITSHNVFISLASEFRDKCLMIFQNPDSSKEYLGGIGTVNSVSRGHESMPCAQFIMLTRRTLTCDENEIADFLHLSYRKMTFSDEENMLVSRLKRIMLSSGVNSMNGANLSDDETDVLISHNIEKLVNNLIKHQYFKCATISIQDDYNWYKSMEKYFDESFEE